MAEEEHINENDSSAGSDQGFNDPEVVPNMDDVLNEVVADVADVFTNLTLAEPVKDALRDLTSTWATVMGLRTTKPEASGVAPPDLGDRCLPLFVVERLPPQAVEDALAARAGTPLCKNVRDSLQNIADHWGLVGPHTVNYLFEVTVIPSNAA